MPFMFLTFTMLLIFNWWAAAACKMGRFKSSLTCILKHMQLTHSQDDANVRHR
jgi:hypothetical protein